LFIVFEVFFEKVKAKFFVDFWKIFYFYYIEEFKIFIQYTRELKFDENPDYDYLKKLIQTIADRNTIILDDNYDWIIKRDKMNSK
jgi:hypothetical protein